MDKKYFLMMLVLFITPFSVTHAEYFYNIDQYEIQKVDSIISIKFDTSVVQQTFETFAYQVEAIDESIEPQPLWYGFVEYAVEDGHNIDSLLEYLTARNDVLFAYPVFKDTLGGIYKLNDRFAIRYNDTVSQATIDSIEQQYAVELTNTPHTYTKMRLMRVTGQSPENCLDIANAFYESGLVEYSQPDFIPVELFYEPSDPLFQYQYHLYNDGSCGGAVGIDIAAKTAWNITMGDSGVIIAIIDDGCVFNHEDIDPTLMLPGYDFLGSQIAEPPRPDNDPSPGPKLAHGTACQGIIFAQINETIGLCGVAPKCKLLPIKIWDDAGIGGSSTTIHDALVYAVENGASIVSNSWGYKPPSTYIQYIADAIDYGVSRNVVFVFAAGNFGDNYIPGISVCFPARLPTTIAVGAIKRDGDHWIYSGNGPQLDVVAPSGYKYIEFPETDLYTIDQMGDLGWNPEKRSCSTTTNSYLCYMGGTSGAAPQVAGILGLVKSRRPDIESFDLLKKIIDSSAVDGKGDYFDKPGWDPNYGYGIASAFRALLAVCRGDANNDHNIDILDILYLIDFVYNSGPEPTPHPLMGDANGSGSVNLMDMLYLISYLYDNPPGPPPPISFNYGEYEF